MMNGELRLGRSYSILGCAKEPASQDEGLFVDFRLVAICRRDAISRFNRLFPHFILVDVALSKVRDQ